MNLGPKNPKQTPKIPSIKNVKQIPAKAWISLALTIAPIVALNNIDKLSKINSSLATQVTGYHERQVNDLSRLPLAQPLINDKKDILIDESLKNKGQLNQINSLNTVFLNQLAKMNKVEDFNDFIQGLQNKTGILIEFPQTIRDLSINIKLPRAFSLSQLNSQEYEIFKTKLEVYILTSKVMEIGGSDIRTIQIYDSFSGRNSATRTDKNNNPVNSSVGGYYDGSSGTIAIGFSNPDLLDMTVHEATHGLTTNLGGRIQSEAKSNNKDFETVQATIIFYPLYDLLNKKNFDNSSADWLENLSATELIRVFAEFQIDYHQKQPERYEYQGKTSSKNPVEMQLGTGSEFIPMHLGSKFKVIPPQRLLDQSNSLDALIGQLSLTYPRLGTKGVKETLQYIIDQQKSGLLYTKETRSILNKKVTDLKTSFSSEDHKYFPKLASLRELNQASESEKQKFKLFLTKVDSILATNQQAYLKYLEYTKNMSIIALLLGMTSFVTGFVSGGTLVLEEIEKVRSKKSKN